MDTSQELALQKLIASISEYKASDLHLSVGVPPMLRIEGVLNPLAGEPLVDINLVDSIKEAWLDEEQKKKLEKEKEIIYSYTYKDRVRFKVTIIKQQGTYSISLKLISDFIRPYEDLGFPESVQKIISGKKGFLIVAGPYNSGRTSTLSSMVEYLNQNYSKRIVTLEDPMEVLFHDNQAIIEQREVGRDVVSKSEGLDNIMHEDVDVAVVHSMEDASCLRKALAVAASGRLVLASVNSDGIVPSLKKMMNSFSQEGQSQFTEGLADNLSVAIAQKIIPKIGGGQVLAFEIMLPNQAIKAMIKEGDLTQIYNTMQTARAEGMVTMDQKLAELVNNGIIKLETAQENAANQKDLQVFLNQ
ncbi:Flp pilus assembly complex ATPase component TadA [Patescibacteria group bacterium]|nr:Flp pilus assembly complex ATPase component TadA [Patescibacteria group bacterium]MBU1673017.1 Flp pilus assembly complex ATPase component TadA [Patescibacteria group bacterium]MBU1964176.1 Flp pilus assembly complex ATPase component TadA [Patescibacteria group bacterium]